MIFGAHESIAGGVFNAIILGHNHPSGSVQPSRADDSRNHEGAVVTTGQFDVLAEFVCRDWRHFVELVGRVRSMPGVVSAETFLYLDLCKQLFDWGTAGASEGGEGSGDRRRQG